MTCALYTCLCGITFTSFYFIFKPDPRINTSKSQRFRQRLLILATFLVTIISVAATMTYAFTLFQIMAIQTSKIPYGNDKYLHCGLAFAIIAVALSFILVY